MERVRLELTTLGLEDRCSIQLSYHSRQVTVYNLSCLFVNLFFYITFLLK